MWPQPWQTKSSRGTAPVWTRPSSTVCFQARSLIMAAWPHLEQRRTMGVSGMAQSPRAPRCSLRPQAAVWVLS